MRTTEVRPESFYLFIYLLIYLIIFFATFEPVVGWKALRKSVRVKGCGIGR